MVLNWLLVGSLGLTAIAFISALFSYIVLRDNYLLLRLAIIIVFLLLFGSLLFLSRRRQWQLLPPLVIVLMFFAAAFGVVARWGILVPTGILLFSLVVVMAGILLGARFSLYMAFSTVVALSAVEYAKVNHYLRPDLSWEQRPSSFSDVAGFTAIFAALALVSWLFNRQMEEALRRAQRSEKALKRQRDLLEVKVEERTRELKAAQIEQMQQFYRFAELGHLSTALFHDLANHLSSVSIDIEGLRKDSRSDILGRIHDNIVYIDGVVRRVRKQIQGQNKWERFDAAAEVREIVGILSYHAAQAKVAIELQAPDKPIMFKGDLTRFRQIIINLLTNGIESYQGVKRSGQILPAVTIVLEKQDGQLKINVGDQGKGIDAAESKKIFEPFYTTKNNGMGIGLFIVKQVAEKDFGGSISLINTGVGTTFEVVLPLKGHGGKPART